jgi:diguanylate cyclase
MSDTQSWKDEYLASLEPQEAQERHWQSQFELLHRSLVRSSLAAEGSDPAVDQEMRALRDILRHKGYQPELEQLLPRLDRTLVEAEQRRHLRGTQLLTTLSALTDQLQQLELPAALKNELRALAKANKQRAHQPAELPLLLSELSALQEQALRAIHSATPAPSLLQRLFGSRPAAVEPEPTPTTTPAQARAEAPPSAAEPSYSSIAEHVQSTLLSLLSDLKPPPACEPQVEDLRQRISAGLNLYELVTVLDDLAQLVLTLAGLGTQEFEGYLQQLNQRLASVHSSLRHADEGVANSIQAARQLDGALRGQVGGLQTSMQQATDLPQLKQALEAQVDGLLQTMDHFQHQVDAHEQALEGHVQQLYERVQKMELEAQDFHHQLEQQRQKALHDNLTGLPNRSAWDERLALEMARWERYGGDLLLAVVDIDFFKRINDGYGHLAGDKVLKLIASELRKRLRQTDFIARFGGEEFVLLLPATSLEAGRQLMDTLREGIADCPFHFKGERVGITLSAGITAFRPGEHSEAVFSRADQALYRAKQAGRNQVASATE